MGGLPFPAQGVRLVMIRHTALPRRCFPSTVIPSGSLANALHDILMRKTDVIISRLVETIDFFWLERTKHLGGIPNR